MRGSRQRVGGQDGYENYAGSFARNPTQYGNKEVDALSILQSQKTDRERRRKFVWQNERRLAEDLARPIIVLRPPPSSGSRASRASWCRNGIFNNWRFADVSLDN